jgi:HPt (histidine-containing phosphotransfer) domain-containing protein
VQPIDLVHLAGQTGGDALLEGEVLRLFVKTVSADLQRLAAADGTARREAAHKIVGSARAIGAGEVAQAAAAVEAGKGDVAALTAAVDAACAFIDARLAAPGGKAPEPSR